MSVLVPHPAVEREMFSSSLFIMPFLKEPFTSDEHCSTFWFAELIYVEGKLKSRHTLETLGAELRAKRTKEACDDVDHEVCDSRKNTCPLINKVCVSKGTDESSTDMDLKVMRFHDLEVFPRERNGCLSVLHEPVDFKLLTQDRKLNGSSKSLTLSSVSFTRAVLFLGRYRSKARTAFLKKLFG